MILKIPLNPPFPKGEAVPPFEKGGLGGILIGNRYVIFDIIIYIAGLPKVF
jgi:hypothetical protein